MANIKISELNELYEAQKDYNDYVPVVDTSADETKKISVKNLIRSNVQLIAVTDTEPAEYETGDKYYNTTDNRIYTATSSGWANAETPIRNIFYVVISDKTTYTYDDDNETLISVGGGTSGGGGETLPIGTVLEFPTTDSTKVPDGWLFCDGSAVSRTTYADLFAIIGTSWGAGDGSTTFNLPTKEGLVSVGIKSSDTDFDTIGKTGGTKTNKLSLENYAYKVYNTDGSYQYNDISTGWAPSGNTYGLGSSFNSNRNTPVNNIQPYTVTNYIIKATQTTPVQAEVVNDYSTSQENAYSCDYSNKTFGGTILWTNPNPTSDFQDGTITLNSNNYDELLIIYSQFRTNNQNGSVKLLKGTGTRLVTALSSGTIVIRNFDYVDDTHYSISGGNESNLYPLYVIGYKTGLFN